jgi:hypothetical protein
MHRYPSLLMPANRIDAAGMGATWRSTVIDARQTRLQARPVLVQLQVHPLLKGRNPSGTAKGLWHFSACGICGIYPTPATHPLFSREDT